MIATLEGFNLVVFLSENWITLTSVVGGVWIYFSERRKRQTEGRISLNDATEGMQAMYDKFVEDANYQYDKLNEKITKLQENESKALQERDSLASELLGIKSDIVQDKRKILELESRILEYEEQIRQYKTQVKNLTTELAKYKS